VVFAMHCNLKAAWHCNSHSRLFWPSLLRMRRNCYFWTSGQNSDCRWIQRSPFPIWYRYL